MDLGKLLIITGIILVSSGILWHVGSKYLHLGRLPGDISIEKKNVSFYFPLTTYIILSIVLTLLFLIYRLLSR